MPTRYFQAKGGSYARSRSECKQKFVLKEMQEA
jgi:hypothetical protein